MTPEPTQSQVADGNVGGVLIQIALSRIADDKLALPPLPDTAQKALVMLRHPDTQLQTVGQFLQRDPLLSANLLRLASTAGTGGAERATSVPQAAVRLGVTRLRTVLLQACARQLFDSRDPRIAKASKGMWEHSLAVGMVAKELAKPAGQDPETAYFAGLVHDVGKPVLAALLLDAERRMSRGRRTAWLPEAFWVGLVQAHHREIGLALAERWTLPDAVLEVLRATAYDEANRTSIVNVVRLANAIAKRGGVYIGAVDVAALDAEIAAGRELLGVTEDVVDPMVKTLRDGVRAMAA